MSRIKEGLIVAGAFTLGIAGFVGSACGDSQEDLPIPTPIVTNLETPPPSILQTPGLGTSTPAETERPKPPIDFPVLSDAERTSWETVLESFEKTQNLTRTILVKTEQIEISTGIGSPGEKPSMSARIHYPGSAQKAEDAEIENRDLKTIEDIKSLWTQKLCDAVAPAVPQGIVWSIATNNSGSMDPYGDLGLTLEAKYAFKNTTVCPEK